jgi:hypothetical protein
MENEVLIVHAYDKHLASDSEKCRNKYERVNGKTHLYDLAVQNVAKIIASGVPVEQLAAHGVSFINRNPRSAAYANVNLGYKKVMSANSSTVYFAISDSSQLFEGDLADQKIPCLVVLAETDKGLQVSALKRIRGVSSAALRRKGSNVR